jgi:hypothetical protein
MAIFSTENWSQRDISETFPGWGMHLEAEFGRLRQGFVRSLLKHLI